MSRKLEETIIELYNAAEMGEDMPHWALVEIELLFEIRDLLKENKQFRNMSRT